MNRRSIIWAVLLVTLISHISPIWAEPDNPDKCLDAIQAFAGNLKSVTIEVKESAG